MSGTGALPSIDVIVVNFRTASLVISCLETLEQERRQIPELRAIVVDNASGDGSAAEIQRAVEARDWDWVKLIASSVNGGYGAGNNIGICWALARHDPADCYWLLNPDTEVRPGAGLALARFMATHPNAGVAGSALLERDGRPWSYAFRFPTIMGELERGARLGFLSRLLANRAVLRSMGDEADQVDWVSGASFLIRRELLDAGLRFDETYFLYYEETDFCLQARRAGWECWYVPGSVVMHIAGQSTGVTGHQIALRRLPGYWFRSRQYYFLKNHGRLYSMLADLAWISGHLVSQAKRLARSHPQSDPPRLLSDFVRYSAFVPRRMVSGWNGGRPG
jgi:GT2 family glycosyltransferase